MLGAHMVYVLCTKRHILIFYSPPTHVHSGVHRVYDEVLQELGDDAQVMGIVTNGLLFTMRIKPSPPPKK